MSMQKADEEMLEQLREITETDNGFQDNDIKRIEELQVKRNSLKNELDLIDSEIDEYTKHIIDLPFYQNGQAFESDILKIGVTQPTEKDWKWYQEKIRKNEEEKVNLLEKFDDFKNGVFETKSSPRVFIKMKKIK
jgi:hypothetical protein